MYCIQVDEASFLRTQASLSEDLASNITAEFNIDWSQVQYDDLSKPLYSGTAAMLKISADYRTGFIPVTIIAQANYWAASYTTNQWSDARQVYINASEAIVTSTHTPGWRLTVSFLTSL